MFCHTSLKTYYQREDKGKWNDFENLNNFTTEFKIIYLTFTVCSKY